MFTSDRDTIIIDSYEIIEEEHRNSEEGRVRKFARGGSRQTASSARASSGNIPGSFITALIYLVVSMGIAFAGAIYELFSHGVYSYYMIYAFAITLIGGALPYMLSYIGSLTDRFTLLRRFFGSTGSGPDARHAGLYHAGVATLTIGSIMKGVLDIYGTTNWLITIYPVAAALLILASIVIWRRQSTIQDQLFTEPVA